MTDWLHEKIIDIVTLILAALGMVGAYVTGQRRAARQDENVKGRLDLHDVAIESINRRLESGDETLVYEEHCAQRRENLKQSVIIDEERARNKIERRIDRMEGKLDEISNELRTMCQGQSQISDNQRVTSGVLAELVERLSRRSTDPAPNGGRRHDD